MNEDASNRLEWIDAENTTLKMFCQIESFTWGQRYVWDKGPDHGKFNFIRLLKDNINEKEFREIMVDQEDFFREHSKTLNIKIPSSVFKEPPEFLDGLMSTGSPLISIIIRQASLPNIKIDNRISIAECKTPEDLELFIEVNASGRGWRPDRGVYEILRQQFPNRGSDQLYYLLCLEGQPACTASTSYFGDKYNLSLLATHREFQRRGLMHYMNLWLTQKLQKDFYVQVNNNEPSYLYYSKLAGAEIVNTEGKYITKN